MKLEHLTDGAPRQWNEVGFRKAFISRVLRKGYVAVSGKKKKSGEMYLSLRTCFSPAM